MDQSAVELPQVRAMSERERIEAQANVAATREHLLAWLHATQREWMTINTIDLVKALSDDGIRSFQQIIAAYRDYRRGKPTGRQKTETDEQTGKTFQVAEMHGEQLTVVEAEQALRYLLGMIRELDPTWTLARL